MSDIQFLLDKLQQRAQLDADIFVLTNRVKQHMVKHGLEQVSAKAGKLILKPAKTSKKSALPSAEVQDLEQAIKAEREELCDANAKQIYELQKTRDLADLKMAKLIHNEWIAELEAKLKLAKQSETKQIVAGAMIIDFQLVEPDYAKIAGDAWFVKALREAKSLKPKPITKAMLLGFLANFYKGYYPDCALDDAWQSRIKDHLIYWNSADASNIA